MVKYSSFDPIVVPVITSLSPTLKFYPVIIAEVNVILFCPFRIDAGKLTIPLKSPCVDRVWISKVYVVLKVNLKSTNGRFSDPTTKLPRPRI